MMLVANPIYDTVFKYMLEDPRIARTIISALLKREVVDVAVKKNEYANITTENLSIFRIDFGATVLEPDGSHKTILIELQKTWLETETLRFRQYLSVHYGDKSNIIKDDPKGFAYPMVTVYLLGHRVGDIEEPIIYVRRKAFDYEDKEVTKGIPDPFVDSLTHDSIIVQIPLLKGQTNNRLENVLNIFCQDYKTANGHLLSIDEERFYGDNDMLHLLKRLQAAAGDQKMKKAMTIEDEYLTALERRDTEILIRDKRLAEQDVQLKEQKRTLQTLIKKLLSLGISIEEISGQTGLSPEEIVKCQ